MTAKQIFRTRHRLVGLCAVLLLLPLWVWLDPLHARSPGRPPSLSTLIRALQKKDSRLNQFEVACWNRLPAAIRGRCRSLQPALARETRHEACTLLAQDGPKAAKATPFLMTALDDPVGWVRVAAAHALGAIGPPASAAKTALIAILRDPAYRSPTNQLMRMRDSAASALAAIAPQDPEVVAALLEYMAFPGAFDSPAETACELMRRTPEALPLFGSIRQLLRQQDTLRLVGPVVESYPDRKGKLAALLELLEDEDYGIRCRACRALRGLGPMAAEALPRLLELFRATDKEWEDAPEGPQREQFRAYSAFAPPPPLASAGNPYVRYFRVAPSAVPAPGVTVTRPAPAPAPTEAAAGPIRVRYGFRGSDHGVGQAFPADLVPGLGGLHCEVILTLGDIGPPAIEAIPLLVRECQDRASPLWLEAALARVRIDGRFAEVRPILAAGFEQADAQFRGQILSRVLQSGWRSEDTMTLLIKALDDPDPVARTRTLTILAFFPLNVEPALPALRKMASDSNPAVRRAAEDALRGIESTVPRVP